jgi:hypothetical protein
MIAAESDCRSLPVHLLDNLPSLSPAAIKSWVFSICLWFLGTLLLRSTSIAICDVSKDIQTHWQKLFMSVALTLAGLGILRKHMSDILSNDTGNFLLNPCLHACWLVLKQISHQGNLALVQHCRRSFMSARGIHDL